MTFEDPPYAQQRRERARARLEQELTDRTRKARRMGTEKTIVGVIIVIAFIVIGFFAFKGHNDWEKSCVARGGHVSSHTNWRNSSDNSDTTYYCLNDNGGIIDIR